MRRIILIPLLLAAILGLSTSIYFHRNQQAKLPPLYIETPLIAHYPTTFVSQIRNHPQAGKKIYHGYCISCHAAQPMIPVHAPRLHHPSEWAAYLKLKPETLLKMASHGHHAMPARGGCFECSDQQLKQAIHYMLIHMKDEG